MRSSDQPVEAQRSRRRGWSPRPGRIASVRQSAPSAKAAGACATPVGIRAAVVPTAGGILPTDLAVAALIGAAVNARGSARNPGAVRDPVTRAVATDLVAGAA